MRKNPSEESSAEEPYIVKVYDANDCVDIHTAVNYKGGLYEAQARLKTHYLMSDGTWRIGESYAKGQWYDKPYKYRYILSSGEACDETAIVLSNRPDLTYFDGLRLIYGSDLNYKYSLEAFRRQDRCVGRNAGSGSGTLRVTEPRGTVIDGCSASAAG